MIGGFGDSGDDAFGECTVSDGFPAGGDASSGVDVSSGEGDFTSGEGDFFAVAVGVGVCPSNASGAWLVTDGLCAAAPDVAKVPRASAQSKLLMRLPVIKGLNTVTLDTVMVKPRFVIIWWHITYFGHIEHRNAKTNTQKFYEQWENFDIWNPPAARR